MKNTLVLFIVFLFSLILKSQNIVNNSSFEDSQRSQSNPRNTDPLNKKEPIGWWAIPNNIPVDYYHSFKGSKKDFLRAQEIMLKKRKHKKEIGL